MSWRMVSTHKTLPLVRIEAFSDNVITITLTLLVFQFTVPVLVGPDIEGQLMHFLVSLQPKIIGYIVSFVTIAAFWISHYYMIHEIKYSDRGLLWLNNLFLLFLAFIPFPTWLVGEYPYEPLAVMLYGCHLCLTALSFTLFQMYISWAKLYKDASTEQIHSGIRKSLLSPVLYLLGTALGHQVPVYGLLFFLLAAVLSIFPFFWVWVEDKGGTSPDDKRLPTVSTRRKT